MKKIFLFFTIVFSFIFICKSSYAYAYKKVPKPKISINYDTIPENSKYIDILVPELIDSEYYISTDKPTHDFLATAEIINYKDSHGFVSLTFNYKVGYEFDSLIINEEGNEIWINDDTEVVNRATFNSDSFNHFKIAFLDENGNIILTTNELNASDIFEYTYEYINNELVRHIIDSSSKNILSKIALTIIVIILIMFFSTIILFIVNLNSATLILRLDTKKKFYFDRLTIVLVSFGSLITGLLIVTFIYNIYLNIKMKKALKELNSNVEINI